MLLPVLALGLAAKVSAGQRRHTWRSTGTIAARARASDIDGNRGLYTDNSKHREHPIITKILTIPLVGCTDLNGTALGDLTDLRFDHPYRTSPTGLLAAAY
eukprot:6178222-Pleurochrysis_carterae.AAC.5